MLEKESFLNLKICTRINEESMSFSAEGSKFEFQIHPINNTFTLTLKDLTNHTSYSTKLLLADFQKSEIFKNNQNSHSIKETIFKIIMNSFARIKFNRAKCFINLTSYIQSKETNFLIELNEDINLAVLIHNLTKRVDDLEKQNKLFKLENEKLKADLIHLKNWKEKEVKELKELDAHKTLEISNIKNNLERINLVITSNKFLINPYQDLLNLNSNESEGKNREKQQENNFFSTMRSNKSMASNAANVFGINLNPNTNTSTKMDINNNNLNNIENKSLINQDLQSQKSQVLNNNLNNLTNNKNQNVLNTINESKLSSLKCLTNENNNINTNSNNLNTNTNPNKITETNQNQNLRDQREKELNNTLPKNEKTGEFLNLTSKNVVGNSNSNLNVNTIGSNIPNSPPPLIRRQVENLVTNQIKNLSKLQTLNSNQNFQTAEMNNNNANNNLMNIQESFVDFNLEKNANNNNININEMEKSKLDNKGSNNIINNNLNISNNSNLQPEREKGDFNVVNSSPILAGNNNNNNNMQKDQKDVYDYVLKKEMNMNNMNNAMNLIKKEEAKKINSENNIINNINNNNAIPNRDNREIEIRTNFANSAKTALSPKNLKHLENIVNVNNNENNTNTNSNINPLFTFSNNLNSPKFQMGGISQQNQINLNNMNNINNINNNNIKIQENLNEDLNLNLNINNNINKENSQIYSNIINNNNNNNNNNITNNNDANNNFINQVENNQEYNYTELFLKKPLSNFKLENNIKFFYQVNKGEISETTLWTPFDEEDCIMLELHYPNYLIGGPSEIFLEKMNKVVNFKYMMLVDAENSENHIHIKRSLPHKMKNVIRKNRYNFEEKKGENLLKNKVIPSVNVLKDFNKYADFFTIFEFNFIKNHSFDVKIPKKFEYLYKECIKKNNYGGFVVSLREEIEALRRFYEKENSVFLSYLDNMENSPKFFQIILQMYSEDGFLNGELNKVLRKPNLENLDKIKYFYLAVLVSLTFCSLNVRPKIDYSNNNLNNITTGNFNNNNNNSKINKFNSNNSNKVIINNENEENNLNNIEALSKSIESNKLEKNFINSNIRKEFETLGNNENSLMSNKNFNLKSEKNLFLYSPYKISNTEMDFYKSNSYKILFFDEFISSTPNKQKAENYLKAFKSIDNEFTEFNFNNKSKEELKNQELNPKENNISVILEIEIPYYMLENDNTHIDTLAFTYQENFTLFPQEEEVIIKSGTIFMLKDIRQNTKEAYNFTVSLVALSFSWKGFFDGLGYNKLTKEINLNKNGIGNFRKSVKYLCEALVKNNNIETLSLKENNFGENFESMKYLANLIAINDLKEFNHILNYYKIQNPKDIEFIRNSLPKIKILELANNSIGKNSNISKIFCEALQMNQNIKFLDLNSNNFSDVESAKFLSSALVSNKFIENLDLSLNNLGLNLLAANYLSEAFMINQRIQILNLSENNLGERPDIVKNLFEAIGRNSTLRKLNISGNAFGVNSISVRYLVEGIIFNENIFELNLSNNLLGNVESLTYLCALLEKNCGIEILDLGKNKFGINKESYTLLGEGLAKARNVHTLNLANNNLNTHTDYLKSLLDAILTNGNLKKVNFSYNSLSNCEDFRDFLKKMNRDKNINYIGNNTEIC